MRRNVLLIVNSDKAAATQAAAQVREHVIRHGNLLGEVGSHPGAAPDLADRADLIVVFGGDGTLLGQARQFANTRAAMLGVNIGRLGFLAEFDVASLVDQAETIFGGGPLPTFRVPLLGIDVFGKDGTKRVSGLALNDVALTAGPPYRLISLSLSIDGAQGPTINGDGVIVSTPMGSTAYNLSAGGPILSPMVDAFAITPIAVQSLAFRPVVVGGNSSIAITVNKANLAENGSGTTLVIDGQVQHSVTSGERIVLAKSRQGVTFVSNPKIDYWARLIGKLNWAATPRYGSSS